ncbi:hypothetical protein R0135_01045 [Congregibacter variabilis]|uniref:Uncharacterized protein n=1 Tax=Congregibacter variabilis TaxID=3081200 RepID=A0ABZ0I419_9GAMM|nr:hypothetical protein R0135_01045 [Congregibacter sp. IMCC43200]
MPESVQEYLVGVAKVTLELIADTLLSNSASGVNDELGRDRGNR